jgi:hypothetical protein
LPFEMEKMSPMRGSQSPRKHPTPGGKPAAMRGMERVAGAGLYIRKKLGIESVSTEWYGSQ